MVFVVDVYVFVVFVEFGDYVEDVLEGFVCVEYLCVFVYFVL